MWTNMNIFITFWTFFVPRFHIPLHRYMNTHKKPFRIFLCSVFFHFFFHSKARLKGFCWIFTFIYLLHIVSVLCMLGCVCVCKAITICLDYDFSNQHFNSIDTVRTHSHASSLPIYTQINIFSDQREVFNIVEEQRIKKKDNSIWIENVWSHQEVIPERARAHDTGHNL